MRDWFRRHNPGFHAAEDTNREIPEDLWVKCPGCGELLYERELEHNLYVCPKCSNHFRLRSRQRVDLMTDEGSFE